MTRVTSDMILMNCERFGRQSVHAKGLYTREGRKNRKLGKNIFQRSSRVLISNRTEKRISLYFSIHCLRNYLFEILWFHRAAPKACASIITGLTLSFDPAGWL
jgi:hypothetical protein